MSADRKPEVKHGSSYDWVSHKSRKYYNWYAGKAKWIKTTMNKQFRKGSKNKLKNIIHEETSWE